MTQEKKKGAAPSWKALAGASRVAVDEPAVTGAEPAKTEPAKTEPEADTHAVIKRAPLTSKWPQLSVRVDPGAKEAYAIFAERGGSGAGRMIVAEALDEWFLKHEPVNDYTRALHEKRKGR